ncbi:MAG TPA: polysaccharide deacetylase family protein [Solirubrobacteraceae bacterium]|nr:polysaccharide deacetylase family protein [Solirubrobacteraceae bacterium]
MSNDTMTTGDHRTPRAVGAFALAASLVSGAYAFPALAGALTALRAPLGIAQHTIDGSGYGLTFDDGPHREGTPAVLEALAARGVRATFFLVGEQVARNPSLAAEIVAAGHGIGLHCDRHRNQLRLGPRAVREDIMRGAARIEETTGRPIERYRPPYGIFNAAALKLVRANGWRPLLWTHWGRDWEARATPESIVAKLVGGDVGEGSVLLLHDADDYGAEGSWRRTAAALPRVLATLEERGLAWNLGV